MLNNLYTIKVYFYSNELSLCEYHNFYKIPISKKTNLQLE